MRISKKWKLVAVGVMFALISMTLYDSSQNFTVSALSTNSNSYGLKAEVVPSDPSRILCPCPYVISFSTDKMVEIREFEICENWNCIKQETSLIFDPVVFSPPMKTAILNPNVPWTTGDDVEIHVKVNPLEYCSTCGGNGGHSYHSSDMKSTWIDLGSSKVQ